MRIKSIVVYYFRRWYR